MEINDINQQELVNTYNSNLANMMTNHIEKLKYGFVEDDCANNLFSILIHCIENIDIFNKNQLGNITCFIDKLNYGK